MFSHRMHTTCGGNPSQVTAETTRTPSSSRASRDHRRVLDTAAVQASPQEAASIFGGRVRTLVFGYLAVVFVCRLLLRSAAAAETIHWAVVMMLEDGLSITSFCFAFLTLQKGGGAPLVHMLSKRFVLGQEIAELETSTDATSAPMRLFYFAL